MMYELVDKTSYLMLQNLLISITWFYVQADAVYTKSSGSSVLSALYSGLGTDPMGIEVIALDRQTLGRWLLARVKYWCKFFLLNTIFWVINIRNY